MTNNFEQNRKTRLICEESSIGTKTKTAIQTFTAADLWNIHKSIRQKSTRKFL